jgi:CheY-like chemotaxis protein
MDPITQERMFEPFFSTKFTGRGLGLAAVQGVVQVHAGVIGVKSAAEQGTTFAICLPAIVQRNAPQTTTRSKTGNGNGTILVIDGEEAVRAVTQRLLERLGFTALMAANVKIGLELFLAHSAAIACVIQDVTPTLSLSETEQALAKMRAIRPDMPIILVSGYAVSEALRSLDPQRTAFLQKPFSADELRQVLQQLVADQ